LQAFHKDLPREKVDFAASAIQLVEGERGVKLTDEQKTRIICAEQVGWSCVRKCEGATRSSLACLMSVSEGSWQIAAF